MRIDPEGVGGSERALDPTVASREGILDVTHHGGVERRLWGCIASGEVRRRARGHRNGRRGVRECGRGQRDGGASGASDAERGCDIKRAAVAEDHRSLHD